MDLTNELIYKVLREYEGHGSLTGIQVWFHSAPYGEIPKEEWRCYLIAQHNGKNPVGHSVTCLREYRDRSDIRVFISGLCEEIEEHMRRVAPGADCSRYRGNFDPNRVEEVKCGKSS